MPISLNQDGGRGYEINPLSSSVIPCVFLSGATYSLRHFSLAATTTNTYDQITHIGLGILQLCPVIGGVAAIADWQRNKDITPKTQASSDPTYSAAKTVLNPPPPTRDTGATNLSGSHTTNTAQTTTTLNTPQPLKIKLSKHLTYFPKDNLLQSTRSPLNPNSAVIINPKITDKKIALKVIKANKEAFCCLSKELKEDPDIKKELGLE